MVNTQQLVSGLMEYAYKNIMPKLDYTRQFAAGMVMGIAASKAQNIVTALAANPAVKVLGVVREDGSIDLDALYAAATAQMERQQSLPIDVPFIGRLTFDKSDIDQLYQTICRQ